MSSTYSQAYGFQFWFQVIKKESLDLGLLLPNAGLGAGKFIDNTSTLPNTSLVFPVGSGDTFKLLAGAGVAVTKAAIASNVATLTFAAAHGIANGASIGVAGLPAPFEALNGTHTVTAVTTSSPYTLSFAFTAANITEATVASGKVVGTALALDGTDAPVRLLGLTNCAENESEGEETVQTYDDEAKSFDTSMATSKSLSWSLSGITNHRDAGYKLMRIAAKESVRSGLMIKYVRIGPVGSNEKSYGYGRFTGYEPDQAAGSIVKYSNGVRAYGPYELELDN